MFEKIQTFINGVNVPTLSEKDKSDCENEINEDEVSNVLKEMKNGSSPGIDGLSIEFYKVFWDKIKKIFQTIIYLK